MAIILSFIYPSPRKSKPSHINNLQKFFILLCLPNISIINQDTHIIGKAKAERENLSPRLPSKTSVNGAPIFVPKIIPKALGKAITPAHTKAKVIKETTLLLCNIAVTTTQVQIALYNLFVAVFRKFLKVFVSKKPMASSKTIVPNKNIHNHQIKSQTCSRVINQDK